VNIRQLYVLAATLGASALLISACGSAETAEAPETFAGVIASLEAHEGFLDTYADADGGRVLLALPVPDADTHVAARAIHLTYLRTGLGSNPVGLDRGASGSPHVVAFIVRGGKVYLEAENNRYVASSDNPAELRAVSESFARSIIWSGEVTATAEDGRVLVDISSLLVSDALNVARQLKDTEQGDFTLDAARSAVLPSATLTFPDNIELEAFLTFASARPGGEVRATAPAAEAVTLTVHHSFVRLPPPGFKTRDFDPRMGVIAFPIADYAAGLDAPIERRATLRFRLEKEDPGAPSSPARDPIVFYVDPGAPEPVRSALIEGAGWWSEAFEAAGFEDGYRVEVLPDDVHPLDARYNVIQWVHRQTRGWSYGSPIYDPRTGEIIKAVITLGSLRVRQDRVIFEGLLDAERTGSGAADDPVVLALARLRQLAAHEVGHGLGFPHNMAASTDDRASVMDYPAPRVTLDDTGAIDVSDAYAVGLGAWDIANARYLYTDFSDTTDEATQLNAIVRTVEAGDLTFVTDAHARPLGAAHPSGSLWDNGAEPIAALENALLVRAAALSDFGLTNVPDGAPVADLRAVITPIYLWHRYQIAAAAKLIGGYRFSYAVKGDGREGVTPVPAANQHEALAILLSAVDPDVLALPGGVAALLEPHHLSWFDSPSREEFQGFSGPIFDESAAAGVAARMVFDAILEPARASRLAAATGDDALTLAIVLDTASWAVQANLGASDTPNTPNTQRRAIARTVADSYVDAVLALAESDAIAPATAAQVDRHLAFLADQFADHLEGDRRIQRHLNRPAAPAGSAAPAAPTPPGSPIGTLSGHSAMAHRETCWHCGSGQP